MSWALYMNMDVLAIEISKEHIELMTDDNFEKGDDVYLDEKVFLNNIKNGFIVITQLNCFIECFLNAILNFGYGEIFVNLEDVLSEEELEKYKPYLLYVDLAVIDKKNEAIDNDQNADKIPCPDPTKPEEMEKPVPVFVDVTKCEKMANIYSYSSDSLAMAVAVNAPNPDRISDFLAYLFEE